MVTSSYYKYNSFVADVANKLHNFGSDTIEVALTNTAPVATNTSVNGEIAYTNLSARDLTLTSSTQTSGTYSLICQDLTLTASGNVATFRYVALRNKTANKVIGWYDYGSSISMISGDSFAVNLDNVNGILQIV
jgi:hypothetical protein